MHSAPKLGRLIQFEGLLMDENFGTNALPSQVVLFDDFDSPSHGSHVEIMTQGMCTH